MIVEAQVEPIDGPAPAIIWRWDSETDILSGSFKPGGRVAGLTGTVELADDEGSVAVVDVSGGVVRGLDIVIWPPVITVPDLRPPTPAREGRVVLPSRPSQPGVASVELDTMLSVSANADESVIHLRIGSRRAAEPIRVADHLLIELDQRRRLAGFWLDNVPPLTP